MSVAPLPPERERGVILINVLLFVAIASAVVLLMITAEEASLQRSTRLAEASHARAAALGGEMSAIVALRRDAIVAPDSDNATEPWAKVAQDNVAIRGGHFDLAIADAEDRLNINLLMRDDPAALALGTRIAAAAGVSPNSVQEAVGYVRIAGPVSSLAPFRLAGLPPETIARLGGLVTALPADTKVNLNSVGEDLLSVMIGDPVAAHGLIQLRANKGFLVPEDLLVQHISQPPLSSYQSNLFWVRVRVTIGGTTQQLTSLIARRRDRAAIIVAPIERWWGAAPAESPLQ